MCTLANCLSVARSTGSLQPAIMDNADKSVDNMRLLSGVSDSEVYISVS